VNDHLSNSKYFDYGSGMLLGDVCPQGMFRSFSGCQLRLLASLYLTRALTVNLETSSSGIMSRINTANAKTLSPDNIITCVDELSVPFKTLDPFLFCVYHKDNYPAGIYYFPPSLMFLFFR
jgi:hypothetical protein